MLFLISSIVDFTSTPSAVERPTAGSASIARIRLSGKFSTNVRTMVAASEVLPTPPFPATAIIVAFAIIPPLWHRLPQNNVYGNTLRAFCPYNRLHSTFNLIARRAENRMSGKLQCRLCVFNRKTPNHRRFLVFLFFYFVKLYVRQDMFRFLFQSDLWSNFRHS